MICEDTPPMGGFVCWWSGGSVDQWVALGQMTNN